MSINEVVLKTLNYIGKNRALGLVDKIVKETIWYVEKARRLGEEVKKYNEKVRKLYFS